MCLDPRWRGTCTSGQVARSWRWSQCKAYSCKAPCASVEVLPFQGQCAKRLLACQIRPEAHLPLKLAAEDPGVQSSQTAMLAPRSARIASHWPFLPGSAKQKAQERATSSAQVAGQLASRQQPRERGEESLLPRDWTKPCTNTKSKHLSVLRP